MKRKILIPLLVVSILVISLSLFVSRINKKTFEKSYASEDEEDERSSFTSTERPKPDGIIIKYKDNISSDKKYRIVKDAFGDDTHSISQNDLSFENYSSIEVPEENVDSLINTLQSDPNIVSVEPDYYYEYLFTPNDQYFSRQWWLTKIQAPQAWDITKGSPTVYVAIIDSGSNADHPDLKPKIAKMMNPQVDEPNHGTHVAGIAAAATNNSLGVAGIGFNVKLLLVDAGNNKGIRASDAIAGFKWAADNGATSINCSWTGNNSAAIKDAIDYAVGKGVVVVVAAGNTHNTKADFPANLPNVISVAATTSSDALAGFSTRGSWVTVGAPGEGIYSTVGPSNYTSYNGTSMAAPVVTGLAGLIKSAYPGYSGKQISDRICQTADKISGTGSNFRCGRVNAYKAVLGGTGGGSPAPSPTDAPDPTKSIIFKLRFQGITDKGKDQKIKLQLTLNGSTKYSETVMGTSDNNGLYTVMVDNSKANIPTGTYELKAKGTSHLQRKIGNLVYAGESQTFDLTKQENQMLRAGDVNGDNKITIADVSQVLRYYIKFSVPVENTSEMEASDINRDGTITIQDVALIAINWSDFAVSGDN